MLFFGYFCKIAIYHIYFENVRPLESAEAKLQNETKKCHPKINTVYIIREYPEKKKRMLIFIRLKRKKTASKDEKKRRFKRFFPAFKLSHRV
jgi:hypothetical protein